MSTTHSTAARNAATDAVTALIGTSGNLKFRLSGSVSSPGTAAHLTLHTTSGAAQGAGATVAGDAAHLTTQETSGDVSGGGGARHRVRQSREFNDFIESLFKKKSRKQVLQAVVEEAVDEEKLQQNIEFVAEAFRQKRVQRDSALRTELELVETQLRRKLQDLEDEEYAVVSLLL